MKNFIEKVYKFHIIKLLQLEGGLSITAFGVYGIYNLADKLNKSPSVKSVSFYLNLSKRRKYCISLLFIHNFFEGVSEL